MNSEMDVFGRLLMEKFRDAAIGCIEGLCEGQFESPNHRKVQDEISHLSEQDKKLLIKIVGYCTDGALNDFLYNLNKEISNNKKIDIIVNGVPLSEQNKPLHRQLYGTLGWKEQFSEYQASFE